MPTKKLREIGFNSTLVQLKAIEGWAEAVGKLSFNSTLVQLKGFKESGVDLTFIVSILP